MAKLVLLGILLISSAVAALAQSRVAKDLRPQIDQLEKKAVALVEAMPEGKLTWAPSGARNFRAAALHMAFGNYLLLNFTRGKTPPKQDILNKIAQHEKYEQAESSKAEVVKNLKESFSAVRTAMDAKTDEEMTAVIEFFGQEKSTGGMFAVVAEHASEHLGQLIAYARMCGVRPPWSK